MSSLGYLIARGYELFTEDRQPVNIDKSSLHSGAVGLSWDGESGSFYTDSDVDPEGRDGTFIMEDQHGVYHTFIAAMVYRGD